MLDRIHSQEAARGLSAEISERVMPLLWSSPQNSLCMKGMEMRLKDTCLGHFEIPGSLPVP
jgi:hypothetical protein